MPWRKIRLFQRVSLDFRRSGIAKREIDRPTGPKSRQRPTARNLDAVDQRARSVEDFVDRSALRGAGQRFRANPQAVVCVSAEECGVSLDGRQVVGNFGSEYRLWWRRRWRLLAVVRANGHSVDE